MVRVRFAPSPTGELHAGGLRTALFNYLFARRHQGRFILRIEDTDRERRVPQAAERIAEILDWVHLSPDEGPLQGGPCGPYVQSERLAGYRAAVETLLREGHAYPCYVSPQELEQMRTEQRARGAPPRYDGRHRNLSAKQRARFEAEGRKPVIRMRIPEETERIVVQDQLRGAVAFDSKQLDDQVILKSDGYPTYHLAVVVDDHAMGITHILRAEEWLPSTPKHIYLYRWLGYELPQYGHLPLLLNPQGGKLSKRRGDASVEELRTQGYLPQALLNFLALLGWNPGDEREFFHLEELEREFSLERVGKSPAVFDLTKLQWMNAQHLGRLGEDELTQALLPFVERTPYRGQPKELLRQIGAVVRGQLHTLADIEAQLPLFLEEALPDGAELHQVLATESAQRALSALQQGLEAVVAQGAPLHREVFQEALRACGRECQLRGAALFQPVRLALTGRSSGPDLAGIVTVFGWEKTLLRLNHALLRTQPKHHGEPSQ